MDKAKEEIEREELQALLQRMRGMVREYSTRSQGDAFADLKSTWVNAQKEDCDLESLY